MTRALPIGNRLSLMVAIMIGALVLVAFIAIRQLDDQLLSERRNHTRELVEVALSHLEDLNRRALAGELSGDEARARALREVAAMRYGHDNYFWINDLNGVVLSHPLSPELVGRDATDLRDPDGKPIFEEFLRVAKTEGSGFVRYRWAKPGHDGPVGKIAHVASFEPWNWVVGSGLYLDDLEATRSETLVHLARTIGLASVVALGMMLWLRQSISAPLRRVTAAMKGLARGEPVTLPPEPEARDEIRDLIRAMAVFERTQDEVVAVRRAKDEEARITRTVFDTINEAIVVTDAENRIRSVNPAFTRTTGYAADEVLGRDPSVLSSGRHDPAFYAAMWRELSEHGRWSGELWNRRKDGSVYPEALSIHLVRDETGAITEHVAIFSDISERKLAEMRMRWRAEHDALTGLPNRATFEEALQDKLVKAHRDDDILALLFIDLNRFKAINDAHGHATGDEVLRQVGKRIRESLRAEDHVARLGGDEFTVVLSHLPQREDARLVAIKLLRALHAPYRTGGVTVHMGAGIGIAFNLRDDETAADLIRRADQAMYRAKENGDLSLATHDGEGGITLETVDLPDSAERRIDRGRIAQR